MIKVDKDSWFLVVQDIRFQIYIIILSLSIWKCFSLYLRSIHDGTKSGKKHLPSVMIIPPFLLSLFLIGSTWYYIFRFILNYATTSESYFDDAYKDVLQHHYFSSTQLLTWAIVSVTWVANDSAFERSEITMKKERTKRNSSILFLLYGFLGCMAASFVLWIPMRANENEHNKVVKHQRSIPIVFVISSILAFVCICNIQPCTFEDGEYCSRDDGFGSFSIHFRFWLHGLHIILLLPIAISKIWTKQYQVNSALLYGIMGSIFSVWNFSQLSAGAYQMPKTDCQKSIHIDLLFCSLLTLYATYRDNVLKESETETSTNLRSLRVLCIQVVLMPLLSPAALLSFHLCGVCFSEFYRDLIGNFQRYIAAKRNERGWCNLGLWTSTEGKSIDYPQACQNLALALAQNANLQSGDGVLCCGCGAGSKELNFYKTQFDLGHITGLDPSVNTSLFPERNLRAFPISVEDWITDGRNLLPPQKYNKILALDTIYHYPRKKKFFQHCESSLPAGGAVAVTDLIWNDSSSNSSWVKLALSAMGVNSSDVWTESEYQRHLESLGFVNVKVQRIGKDVFSGWKRVFSSKFIQHLDYAVIVANTKDNNRSLLRKKRVAVIGSGMAGLVAAHTLHTSQKVEVHVYEAASKPGLAGNTMTVCDQLVDVPARMAAVGYYKEYIQLVEKLGLPYQPVNTDCTFHGKDGTGGYVKHIYERSGLSNLYNSVMVGGLGNFWKMIRAFSSIPSVLADMNESNELSFGDWLHENFQIFPTISVPSSEEISLSASSTEDSDPGLPLPKNQGWDFSYFAKHENPFLYMTIGSFGWMLSCTYEQLMTYPANILLPYVQGLGLTDFLGIFQKAHVVRIEPSIQALENALLYGIKFQGNTKVSNLDKRSKIIDGIKYDAIICATEANAVQYVINDSPKAFRKFQYHPSSIYLHNDSSIMPQKRADWRTWNVHMDPEHELPQLTFWLNRYYDHQNFHGEKDYFQTWAPHRPPREDLVIKQYNLSRVVHTSLSRELVKTIEKVQGKDGMFYAGAYLVYGMGLLEQAAQSGRKSGEHVLTFLQL